MARRTNTLLRRSFLWAAAILVVSFGIAGGFWVAQAAPANLAPASPASAPGAALLPATTCSLTGSTRICNLYAKTGSVTMPDGLVVPIWGFSDTALGAAQLPGPMLIVNQGERVEVTLHNEIPAETIALSFPSQDLVPDFTGVTSGGSHTYVFTPTLPGTFSYEPGLTPNVGIQTAMGLFGGLIVRPAGNPQWAYGSGSAFDDEALLVFSEIDPNFSADPYGFDLFNFTPQYWVVNGQPYTATAPVTTAPGNRVLLRYLNTSLREHSLSVLGRTQAVIADDGNELPFPNQVTAKTLGAGQSVDVLVDIPAAVPVGTRYPVYNAGMQQLHNAGTLAGDGTVSFGGMITFIEVSGGNPLTDTGPLASNLQVSPNPTNGGAGVTLSATLDETNTGGETVIAWEYFTDTVGVPGSGIVLPVAAPATVVNVNTTIPSAVLASWEHGDVTFYLRGQDTDGTWGPINSTVLDLVVDGPVVRSLTLTPDVTNGSVPVTINGTADETSVGQINVIAAEYFVDAVGADGTGTPLALNMNAPIAGLSATLAQPGVDALSEGVHTIYIHAQDALNNWGAFTPISLIIDKTGPPANGISILPNPNNGTLGLNSSNYSVRLMAEIGSLAEASTMEKAEGFIDTIGADGTGFPLMAYDALYDGLSEVAFVDIPLSTIQLLAEGLHNVYFHGKDAAGNWGPYSSLTLNMDKTGPEPIGGWVYPNPTWGSPTATFSFLFWDTSNGGSIVVAAEWFEGTDPGLGQANPMFAVDGYNYHQELVRDVVDVSTWPNGWHVINLRAKDAAGNWGMTTQMGFWVLGNALNNVLSDGFDSGLANWDGVIGNAATSRVAKLEGEFGLQVMLNGITPTYVMDRSPNAMRRYRASFLFDPHTANTQGGSHQIFLGEDAAGTPLFGVEFRGAPDSLREVRAWVTHSGGKAYTTWQQVTYGQQQVEISWKSGYNAGLTLHILGINGDVEEALTGLDTGAHVLETVRLGAVAGLDSGMTGVEYFDDFNSDIDWANVPNVLFLPALGR